MSRPTTALATANCLLLVGMGTLGLPAHAATPKPVPATSAAAAERDPQALAALDRMGAALRALQQFTLTSEASTEVVLEDGQKIELDGSVSYRVKRPSQVFVALDSDRQQRQLIYDGHTLTVFAPKLKYYAQVEGLDATLGELVEQAASRYDIEFPLADMFLWGTDKAPNSLIHSARHVGGGTQAGEPIEQYAFQQDGVDWQRAAAHANVNRAAQRPANRPVNRPGGGAVNRTVDHGRGIDHNRNVNRDVNRNVNRDVHVDVDHHYDHHDHWNDWDDHPFATAAVTAGVAVTRAVIGSIVYSLPPSCVTTVINGVAYQQCGSDWYEPRYAGTSVQYVVISAPR